MQIISIRGDKERFKALLKKIQQAKGLSSEGAALDFLMNDYQAKCEHECPVNNDIEAENTKLKAELEEKNQLIDLNNEHKEDFILVSNAFKEFKAETEQAIRKLFKNSEYPGHNNDEQLQLLLEYAIKDPCKQFPEIESLKKIYEKFTQRN